MDDSRFDNPVNDGRDVGHHGDGRGAVKFLYWSFGFVCGAVTIAVAVVLFNRFGGGPISPIAGQATATTPTAAVAEDRDFSRARTSVGATLEDPAAAQFEALTTVENEQGKLVCGYVTTKTEGASPRRAPFIYHTRADLSFVLINKKEAFVAGPQIVNACFPNYTVPRTALEASRE